MRIAFLFGIFIASKLCEDFSTMKKDDFKTKYLNDIIPVSKVYKGLSLSFYQQPEYSSSLIQNHQKMTKVDWNKLYQINIDNPFFGVKNSNYMMIVYTFLKYISILL